MKLNFFPALTVLVVFSCHLFLASADEEGATTKKPNPRCGLPRDTGPCRASIPRWFYNVNTGNCETFVWGGCQGNLNRFRRRRGCMRTCAGAARVLPRIPTTTALAIPENLPDVCRLSADGGPFNNGKMVTRFYFNTKYLRCQRFMWTGLGGNANRFESLDECQRACSTRNDTTDTNRILVDNNNNITQSTCDSCAIGHCDDLTKQPSNYQYSSSYLQIFTDFQAGCDGKIDSVKFIDKRPNSGKKFYLTVWEISGLSHDLINEKTGQLTSDLSKVTVKLMNSTEIVSKVQEGWQEYTLPSPVPIGIGHYIGIHLESWKVLEPNTVVPHSEDAAKPTVIVRADNSQILAAKPLPFTVPLFNGGYMFSLNKRKPALVVSISGELLAL